MRFERVDVSVPARLHLGLLDLDGGLGRRFGSLGITLDAPRTKLSLTPAIETMVTGPDGERAVRYLAAVCAHFGLDDAFRLEIEAAIPAHNGLGSGTQLALAVGVALCRLAGIAAAPGEIAGLLDRGARSGIGVGAFEQGGVLLDGGKGAADAVPPILSRLAFPEDWRVLLIYDRGARGLHGAAETAAFRDLPPPSAETCGHLCRLVLLAALPALAEGDLLRFGAAVTELQRIIGDHFAPAQGGRFTSPKVAGVLSWLAAEGAPGIGQSSWGPTGFAILGSEAEARRLLVAARQRAADQSDLRFEIRRGQNSGATIETRSVARTALGKP